MGATHFFNVMIQKNLRPHVTFDIKNHENSTIQLEEWRQDSQSLLNLQVNANLRGNFRSKRLQNISTKKEKFHGSINLYKKIKNADYTYH